MPGIVLESKKKISQLRNPMDLLIGSNNRHKVEELRRIMDSSFPALMRLLIPAEVKNFPREIVESGSSLEENAYIKAAAIYEATGIACVADDTGLEVDALQGAPGVYSARFAGENCSYADNRSKLLADLQGIPADQRTARFRTVICFTDGWRTFFAEGSCPGRISEAERGQAGFAYDPIFISAGSKLTFAEISAEEKNAISHRGRALQNFATRIKEYLAS